MTRLRSRNRDFGPSGGTVTFTPDPQWFGGPVQFGYTLSDGHGGTAQSFIRVGYANALPVPAPHSFTTTVNTQLLLSEDILLVGATDADGDHLSVPSGVSVTNGTLTQGPVNDSAYTVSAPTTTTITAPTITYGSNGVITVTVASAASTSPTGSLSLSIACGPVQTATLVNGSATFTIML